MAYLPVDPTAGWTATTFKSVVVSSGLTSGDAEVRVVANGIPSLPVSITLNPATSISNPTYPAQICSGATASLSVSATGAGTLSYQWYQGTASDISNPVGTNSSGYITPALSSTTSYWVRVTGDCGPPADSLTATVVVVPPVATISGPPSNTCPSLTVDLATETGMSNYQWYVDSNPIVGANSSTYTASLSGTYTVNYDSAVCGSRASSGHAVTISTCLPPPETAEGDSLATAQTWPDKQTLAWPVNSEATSGYHVYRGVKADLPNLLTGSSNSCTRATSSSSSQNSASGISDDPTGVTGQFYWYLVTGLNGTGEGSAGNATSSLRIINSTSTCP